MDRATTLQQAIQHFANYENCHAFMTKLRWPDGKVICPRCGSDDVDFLPNARVFKCYSKAEGHGPVKFSLKVGTIFEDSALGLDKWLPVIWMLSNCKNGVSSWEIHRAMGVTQKTAWFMLQRGRLALQGDSDKLAGEIEADETFIGGNVRNMHRKSKRSISAKNDGNWGKTIVLGLLERDGRVKAAVAPNRRKHHVQPNIIANVEPGSKLYTDEFHGYDDLPGFSREMVNHLQAYVQGKVHTNGMENFWSLLKRGLKGTYVSVDPAHLQRYVDEQVFRFNHREHMNDADRFEAAMQRIVGKRLTYKELIGANADASAAEAPTRV